MKVTAAPAAVRVPLSQIDARSKESRDAMSRVLPTADKRHAAPIFNSAL
jgi:hypothetical protein